MPRYTFQESKIWEAGNPVDPNGRIHRTKRKNEHRARKSCPTNNLGRTWVLTKVEY